ncbi:MAG TPA: hypothetical protein VMZ50_01220 [Phycisphaerae bacterium]|nr:hypothetical protein [Phycisphaerae bacterium]
MKAKTFDCVEMKRKAQERLLAEYEARKEEFSSFAEFIHVTADESEWVRSIRAKIRRARPTGR